MSDDRSGNLTPTRRAMRAAGVSVTFALALLTASPAGAYPQDYPWCVSREGYLSCFYATRQQCMWAASGIGGCAPNPRLLFPRR